MIEMSQNVISISEIFRQLKRNVYTLVLPSMIIFISITVYWFNKPDEYKSEVTLTSVTNNGNLKFSGQLGGLAALAGVNLGSMNSTDKSLIAIEILKSKKFIVDFVEKNNLEADLKAAAGWDKKSNTLKYNDDIYDVKNNIWMSKDDGSSETPSFEEIYNIFESNYSIIQDKTTGIVKLSFIHYSPNVAKRVVDLIVDDINELIRKRDIAEYNESIKYLVGKSKIEKNEQLVKLLYNLIEEQNKNLMLANIRAKYVFDIIDPAVAPEKKFGPKRLIVIISCLIAIVILNIMICVFISLNNRDQN